jgi:hypothetical protein
LRRLALEVQGIDDAQMFGDRIHLRLRQEGDADVLKRLQERILAQGGEITHLRSIPPQLEDVFISLLE